MKCEDCGEAYGCFSRKNPYGKIVIDGHVFSVCLENIEKMITHVEGEITVFGVVKEPKVIVQRSFNFVEVCNASKNRPNA